MALFPSRRSGGFRAGLRDDERGECGCPSGPWTDVAIESEITLSAQKRGKEWEYRVIAVNKAGEGTPSNTVMAVL